MCGQYAVGFLEFRPLTIRRNCTIKNIDPATGTFTATGSMTDMRSTHIATLLSNGNVLITGGYKQNSYGSTDDLSSAELYDPATGIFTVTGGM